MKKAVFTKDAPEAIGPYSQAIKFGNVIFTSGAMGIDGNGALPKSVEEQTQLALSNLTAILASQGYDLTDVVKTTVFIDNMDDFSKVNEIYAQHFSAPYPARSCVEVARLPKGALVEIEAVAVKAQ